VYNLHSTPRARKRETCLVTGGRYGDGGAGSPGYSAPPILAVLAPWGGASRRRQGEVATADQVKALVKSHAEGDDTRFYSVALQVAAHAARGGKANFAQELRDLVDALRKSPTRKALRPVPVAQPRGELAGLLSVSYPDARMADLVLEPAVREQLEQVLLEQRQQDRLRSKGFRPLSASS
jgi:hypothetical protein